MAKAKGGKYEGGTWGWVEWGAWWEEMGQLYLNNNKKKNYTIAL